MQLAFNTIHQPVLTNGFARKAERGYAPGGGQHECSNAGDRNLAVITVNQYTCSIVVIRTAEIAASTARDRECASTAASLATVMFDSEKDVPSDNACSSSLSRSHHGKLQGSAF